MDATASRRRPLLFVALGLVLTVLGIAGVVRSDSGGWGGFIYSPLRVVEGVEPGSAAAAAGLLQGDSVVTVDGRPAAELPMQSRWPTTRPGEVHRLGIVREGRPLTVEVTYRPRGANSFARGALAVLLAFLWCGIWARLTADTAPARALWRAGLAAGVAPAASPNVGGLWNGVLSHVQLTAMVLVCLFILQLLVLFPTPKRVSASRAAIAAVLVPFGLIVAFEVVELFTHPRFYRTTGTVAGLVLVAYLALAAAALIHSLATAPRGELWASGMGWALVGAGVVLAGILAPFVGTALGLPSAMPLALLIGFFPVALALAVRKARPVR